MGWSPRYFVRDLDLINQITIKDFDCFPDHTPYVTDDVHELLSKSLVNLTGQKWRDMRATLSPAFTGSKMRHMFELVAECAEDIAEYFKKQVKPEAPIDCDVKDAFVRCTVNIIASCAFGIRIDCLEDPNNEFYLASQQLGFTSGMSLIKYLFVAALPKFSKWMGIDLFDKRACDFFCSIVKENMEARQRNNIERPDLIHLLMQVRSGRNIEQSSDEENDAFAAVEESDIGKSAVKRRWTDREIMAQCFLFFMAGSDSSANLMTFISYELALNPDVQEKLLEEVRGTHETLNGKRIDYDTLQGMKYMDQVVSETLRLWPQGVLLDRICVRDYDVPGSEGRLQIKQGQTINLSPYLLHTDPKSFADPDKFDPERFSEENRAAIKPGTYIPFGAGPRNCIGNLVNS